MYWLLPNSGQEDERSVATEDDQGYVDGKTKNKYMRDIKNINLDTREGKCLIFGIAKLMCRKHMDKTPNEIFSMYSDYEITNVAIGAGFYNQNI